MNSILVAVGNTPGSLCSPSRGPTSTMSMRLLAGMISRASAGRGYKGGLVDPIRTVTGAWLAGEPIELIESHAV
jgi:hypothetical protein